MPATSSRRTSSRRSRAVLSCSAKLGPRLETSMDTDPCDLVRKISRREVQIAIYQFAQRSPGKMESSYGAHEKGMNLEGSIHIILVVFSLFDSSVGHGSIRE